MTKDNEEVATRLAVVETHIEYIRNKVGDIDKKLNNVMWKVISIGGGAGTIATALALILSKVLE